MENEKVSAFIGALKDKARLMKIGASSKDFPEIDVALTKATNHDRVTPKEKHVTTLKQAVEFGIHRQGNVLEYTLRQLCKRMERVGLDWLVVLKLLTVFHRLFRETNPNFQRALVEYMTRMGAHSILDKHTFRDASTPESQVQSSFIRVYSEYLSERLFLFRALELDLFIDTAQRNTTVFKEMPVNEVLAKLPQAQTALNKLVACVPEAQARSSEVTMRCMEFCAQESFILFRAIGEGIVNICDKFFEMNVEDAKTALQLYQSAMTMHQSLSDFWEKCKEIGGPLGHLHFPPLEPLPVDFVKDMELYIKGQSSADPSKRPAQPIANNNALMGKLTSGWGTVRTAMVNGQLSSSGPALYSGSEVPPSGDFLSGNADAQESPVHDPSKYGNNADMLMGELGGLSLKDRAPARPDPFAGPQGYSTTPPAQHSAPWSQPPAASAPPPAAHASQGFGFEDDAFASFATVPAVSQPPPAPAYQAPPAYPAVSAAPAGGSQKVNELLYGGSGVNPVSAAPHHDDPFAMPMPQVSGAPRPVDPMSALHSGPDLFAPMAPASASGYAAEAKPVVEATPLSETPAKPTNNPFQSPESKLAKSKQAGIVDPFDFGLPNSKEAQKRAEEQRRTGSMALKSLKPGHGSPGLATGGPTGGSSGAQPMQGGGHNAGMGMGYGPAPGAQGGYFPPGQSGGMNMGMGMPGQPMGAGMYGGGYQQPPMGMGAAPGMPGNYGMQGAMQAPGAYGQGYPPQQPQQRPNGGGFW